jgi:hypothetical protein
LLTRWRGLLTLILVARSLGPLPLVPRVTLWSLLTLVTLLALRPLLLLLKLPAVSALSLRLEGPLLLHERFDLLEFTRTNEAVYA